MPLRTSLLAETGVLTILDTKLVEVGDTTITLATAIGALVIIVASVWLAKVARRMIRLVFARRGLDEGTAGTVGGILYYVILVAGLGVALQTMGIDLAALFAAGAIFAIGLGFAMQNIAQNFVSGVILLTERAIKPGDILEVEGHLVKVHQMGIRATIVQTRNGEELIVPNSVLAQGSVKNYSLQNPRYRLQTTVGVGYDSDLRQVRACLERAARELPLRIDGLEPEVFLTEFGDNAVIYDVFVWIKDSWGQRRARSILNEAIWWAFQDQGIVIAFPQLDLHLDDDVANGLRSVGRQAAEAG